MKNEKELTYSADESVKLDADKETITLIGNTHLCTSVFEFEHADKIVINKNSQEIFVIGSFKVYQNGGIIRQAPKKEIKRLRYKIGENIAYVE
jgi:lipopolysaccharide assembly outer membrane protein LptD (OstA)